MTSLFFWFSFIECLKNLATMLQRCKEKNLALNWEKCRLMVKEGIVLGHKISVAGLKVDQAKVSVINTLLPPSNVKGVRSFLGHAGFYKRFIKDFSKIARPLCRLLEKEAVFEFNKECLEAFEGIKGKLISTLVIAAPEWRKEFEIICDASDYAMGVVLGHKTSLVAFLPRVIKSLRVF